MSKIDVNSVYDALLKHLYNGDKINAKIDLRGPMYSGYNSRLFQVQSPQLPFVGALKFCLKTHTLEPDRARAKYEFLALQQAARAMPKRGRYSVPHPYLLISDQGALLTEWIVGTSMSKPLFARRSRMDNISRLVNDAAAWLRVYHQSCPLGPGTLDVDDKLSVLEQLQKKSARSDHLFVSGLAMLERLADAAHAVELQRSWVHGDFKSDNLIIREQDVVGIDIHGQYENVVVYDIAAFMNHVELNLKRGNHGQLRKLKRQLHKQFLDSYAPHSSKSFVLPVLWIRAYLLLSGWLRSKTTARAFLHACVLERQYRHAASSVLRDLERFL